MATNMTLGEEAAAAAPVSPAKMEKGSEKKKPVTIEDKFASLFIDPAINKMSQQMQGAFKELDALSKQMEKEREEKWKMRHIKGRQDIPGPLEGSGQKLEDIISLIEDLVMYEDEEKEKKAMASPEHLDDAAHISMISQGLAAYISTLDTDQLQKLSTRVLSDTTLWLSRLFRFNDASAYYHNDDREGLIRICRLVLHNKYEKYGNEGFNALYTKPPVIYVSGAARPGLGQFICFQLGLPLSSLCTVPCNTMFGSQHTMDIASLERLIKDDVASSKIPLLLVANAGTPLAGHTDNINRLREICDEHKIWLHVEGDNLAALPLGAPPSSVLSAKKANSITLTPSVWLGLPAVPAVTLYKVADPATSLAAGLSSSQVHEKLSALPLWVTLQFMGQKGIVKKVKHAADLSLQMAQRLNTLSTIHLNDSSKPNENENEIVMQGSLKEVLGQTIKLFLQDDVVSTVVVFRYDEDKGKPGLEKAPYSGQQENENPEKSMRSTYDSFNRWLSEKLKAASPKVKIDLIETDHDGVCLRFSPLQSVAYKGTTSDDVNEFIEVLEKLVVQLNNTLKSREAFEKEIEERESLAIVEVPNFAGLGAVQLTPQLWKSQLDDQPDSGKSEIDALNSDLVSRLQTMDDGYLFSSQKSNNDTICVGIGVLTSAVEVEDLVDVIQTVGKEVEDSSKFLETMAEVIRKGIDAANEELRKENEEKIMEEGVLRQIPWVGPLVNWWSPLPKDTTLKGRSLNLSSGELESTESTYKYHMQIQQGSPSPSPKKVSADKFEESPSSPDKEEIPCEEQEKSNPDQTSEETKEIEGTVVTVTSSNDTEETEANVEEESFILGWEKPLASYYGWPNV
ncbi:putative pyridoxal-dependent decarboxylase domain-containing protein 2 isoform X3 [Ptychodera flava]|uniref:putative pyridoxal-dependent decarboxylase domain-containing protein 2 isoform X3 n=1 Tax=Ptychodera flava TaxID=63121 RepID=UPI00396A96DE